MAPCLKTVECSFQEEPRNLVYTNFYFWDVLNPEGIAEGTEKPRLNERGPYAYREIRKKVRRLIFSPLALGHFWFSDPSVSGAMNARFGII